MRKTFIAALLLVGLLGAGWMTQRADLASNVNAYTSIVPALYANSAVTGRIANLAGYGSAVMIVIPDSIDTGQPSVYVVLQDSLRSSTDTAWTVVDSVLVDSAAASNASDNYLELGYQGIGQYLRVVQRASGSAGDSIATAAFILRSNCRAKPC